LSIAVSQKIKNSIKSDLCRKNHEKNKRRELLFYSAIYCKKVRRSNTSKFLVLINLENFNIIKYSGKNYMENVRKGGKHGKKS